MKAMVNGQTYVLFAASVKGDDFTEISWTSSLVEDTPTAAATSLSFDLEQGQFFRLALDTDTASDTYLSYTLGEVQTCTARQAACFLDDAKDDDFVDEGLYIGRTFSDYTGDHKQRIYISSKKSGAFSLQKVYW